MVDGKCSWSGWVKGAVSDGGLVAGSDARLSAVLQRFVAFADHGEGVSSLDDVSPAVAESFVRSRLPDGSVPSVGSMHLRRTGLRLLFRSARAAGWSVGDPTLDLVLPPRSQRPGRPLTDDEVALCRGHALWSLLGARRAAAWALAEATCRSRELAHITTADVDLDARRVWVHGGRVTASRWASLSDWGVTQIGRRIGELGDVPEARLVYRGGRGDRVGQISACLAIDDVLVRSGLKAEPDVRPSSIAAWAGGRILADTGRVDVVARRLGMSSLDRTARFIAFDWTEDGSTG